MNKQLLVKQNRIYRAILESIAASDRNHGMAGVLCVNGARDALEEADLLAEDFKLEQERRLSQIEKRGL